jgi:hypothetical protein
VVGETALQALLFASYLSGMLAPGRGSMTLRVRLALRALALPDPFRGHGGEPLAYRVSVVDLRPEVRLVTLAGELSQGGTTAAKLTCEARLAPTPAPLDPERLAASLGGESDTLTGRVAVVVGAGSGLGAALAQGLALQGCSVYACGRGARRSPARPGRGTIHHTRLDAADSRECERLVEQVLARHGGVDFLLCCAAPRAAPIGFGPAPVTRFNAVIRESIELVSVPIASVIHSLEANTGACLVLSSEAVETMPPEWGHLVTAKGAIEAFVVWAAKRHPAVRFLVARAPRWGDAQGDAIDGGSGVGREEVAGWLVRGLTTGAAARSPELLCWPDRSHLRAAL